MRRRDDAPDQATRKNVGMNPRRLVTRSFVVVLAVGSLAALLTGCGIRADRPDAGAATQSRTLEVDGVTRSYRLHLPAELADDPALVVMMHGGGGSARQAERAYGWNDPADTAGFVVVYPDGLGRTWNAGDCCGGARRDGVDDVAFISALVDELQREFDVAADRTFATGMSNGAMMAYRLACETELFAAIAPVAGTIVTACDGPAPASVLHIHGLTDSQVRMDGEPGDGAADVDGMPVADAVAVFRTAGDCDPAVAVEDPPVTTTASSCANGRRVVLVTVADAGHQWPGSDPREGAADQPSTALDATAVIWEFFAAA
jgi:polyhydroxybutyrate depolymerase